MYINAKMILVETVPGIRCGEMKERGREVEGVNSSMIYLMHCKNLCKCYNVPPPSTTIKKKKVIWYNYKRKRKEFPKCHFYRKGKMYNLNPLYSNIFSLWHQNLSY
jgi:hypothetical protein